MIDEPLAAIHAARYFADCAAHLPFRGIEYRIDRRFQRWPPIFGEQRLQAAFPDRDRANLALQIPLDQEREVHVQENGIPERPVGNAAHIQLSGRYADTFLPNDPCRRIVAGHSAAAHVGMVPLGYGPEGELACDETPAWLW